MRKRGGRWERKEIRWQRRERGEGGKGRDKMRAGKRGNGGQL